MSGKMERLAVTTTMMRIRHLAPVGSPVYRWNNGMEYRIALCGAQCPYEAENLAARTCKSCLRVDESGQS